MRLPEDKIKEAILHPDLDVRDTAIRYFYNSTASDPALVPLAIAAIEKYGRTGAFSFTHYLNLLPQTEPTIAWVVAELQQDCEGEEEPHFYFLNLSRLRVQMNLCEALIDHFSFEGIEPARQFIKVHELTPDLRHLRSNFIATCRIMDARFPEFELWEAEAKNDAQDERKKIQEMHKMAYEAGGDLGLLVEKMKAKLASEQQASAGQSLPRHPRLAQKPPRSQERRLGFSERNRVGRNNPCPCGSGKKFKTCCMRK